MKHLNVKKLVVSALMAAFACVATMVIQVPSPINGYMNLGDCIVLLCGWLLGPLYGAFAAGIGSALADLFSGYILYAPATLVIKALMALTAYYTVRLFRFNGLLSSILSGICAELVMVVGYFGYEACVLGLGIGAAAGIVSNLIQAAFGIVCAVLLNEINDRKRFLKF